MRSSTNERSGPPVLDLQVDAEAWPQRVFAGLVAVQLATAFLDLCITWGRLLPQYQVRMLFNLAREDSVGTFVATTTSLTASAVLWVIWNASRQHGDANQARGWAVLSGLYFYLALDDASKLHERVGTLAKNAALRDDGWISAIFHAFPSWGWIVVFGPIFGALGIYMLAFLWNRLAQPHLRLVLVVAMYTYLLSQSLDFIEGIGDMHEVASTSLGMERSSMRHLLKVAEEFLEMFATSTLIYCYLSYFVREFGGVSLRIERSSAVGS